MQENCKAFMNLETLRTGIIPSGKWAHKTFSIRNFTHNKFYRAFMNLETLRTGIIPSGKWAHKTFSIRNFTHNKFYRVGLLPTISISKTNAQDIVLKRDQLLNPRVSPVTPTYNDKNIQLHCGVKKCFSISAL